MALLALPFAVVVDESSMVDVQLKAALLKALPPHTQLLVVGER